MKLKEHFKSAVQRESRPTNESHDFTDIQERHPDWPKLNVSFYFAPHVVAKDMEGIAPYLAEADVFLYEDGGRSKEGKDLLNLISSNPRKGMKKMGQEVIQGTDMEPVIEGLKGTNKFASTLDIGKNAEEMEMAIRMFEIVHTGIPRGMTYEDVKQFWHDRNQELAKLMCEREDIMVDNFEDEIADILRSRSDLKAKGELNILISMGAYHTRLSHLFAKRGMKGERHFSQKNPYLYGYDNEMMRHFAFGKEPSPELVERALAESILGEHLIRNVPRDRQAGYDDKTHYLREVVSALKPEDIQDLYDAYSEQYLNLEIIDKLLESYGFYRMPRDREELEWTLEEMNYQKQPDKKLAKVAINN